MVSKGSSSVAFKCVVAAVYLGPWFQLEKLTLNEPHHQGNYRLQTSLDDEEHSPKQIRKDKK